MRDECLRASRVQRGGATPQQELYPRNEFRWGHDQTPQPDSLSKSQYVFRRAVKTSGIIPA